MTKKRIETSKLYYGFPVFLIGYKDMAYGYNFSTSSSSYTLGDMITVGIYRHGNAIKQIKNYGCFTVNIPDKTLMKEIEIGGDNSGGDKFKIAQKLTYHTSDRVDAPIIENCILNIECETVKILDLEEFDNYYNIIAKIKGRLVNEDLLKENSISRELLNPVFYLGDGFKRSYRFLNDEIYDNGSFTDKD